MHPWNDFPKEIAICMTSYPNYVIKSTVSQAYNFKINILLDVTQCNSYLFECSKYLSLSTIFTAVTNGSMLTIYL